MYATASIEWLEMNNKLPSLSLMNSGAKLEGLEGGVAIANQEFLQMPFQKQKNWVISNQPNTDQLD